MVTFAEKVVTMSPSDPVDISCLIGCAVFTGAGAVLTANVEPGESMAVFGVGGVGLSAIGTAIVGADPIIAVDVHDRKAVRRGHNVTNRRWSRAAATRLPFSGHNAPRHWPRSGRLTKSPTTGRRLNARITFIWTRRGKVIGQTVRRKLDFAKEFGATHGINASTTEAVEAIWEISPGGVDYALDAVGAPVTALQILAAVREGGPRADNQGGMGVLVGLPYSEVSVALNTILLHQRHYCGSLGATEPDTDFPLFLEWVREGKFPLAKLVTNRYSLEQIDEARDALDQGQILGRAIIEL